MDGISHIAWITIHQILIFAAADLTIGKNVFHMDAKGVTWNGGLQANAKLGDVAEYLARPQICVEAGQSAQVAVGAEFPIEYMEPATDGLFARKVQRCSGGLTVDLTVSPDASVRLTPDLPGGATLLYNAASFDRMNTGFSHDLDTEVGRIQWVKPERMPFKSLSITV